MKAGGGKVSKGHDRYKHNHVQTAKPLMHSQVFYQTTQRQKSAIGRHIGVRVQMKVLFTKIYTHTVLLFGPCTI